MPAVRTVALCVLAWIAWPTVVAADSLTSGSWTTFFHIVATAASPSAPATPAVADAFVNFGSVPDPEAATLTTGAEVPWYQSPSVTQVYGHTPTSAEQSAFTSEVLADVNTTFSLAGLHPYVTTNPAVPSNHTLSVASGLSYAANVNAIGITDVGHNGFGFIDKLKYATSVDELAWAVAHNVSHELMHAFGVANHADQTGTYLDAATATWGLLTNSQSTFSPGAAGLISASNFGPTVTSTQFGGGLSGFQKLDGDQEIMAVPEPSTLIAWGIVVVGVVARKRRLRIAAAA